MWELLYNMSFFRIVCLRIGASWARCPTSDMSFVSNGNMFSRCIDYFCHCSTTQLVVGHHWHFINDYDMFVFEVFYDIISSWRMDKYLCVKIQNAICIVVAIEFKWSVITLVIADNNIFLPSNWNFCVVYNFIKNFFPLPSVPMIICRPFGFLVMEWIFNYSLFNCMMEMCMLNVLWRFENKLHFKDTQIFNSKACIKLIQCTKCFDLELEI
jgi:hypothetical protein